ncbi:MAG: chemotaxis protein CheW, partial [Gammaproteobacteria bacterium]|nr:chemotaxis protein CheW [Gammaproteobacteria bacterium]
PKPEPKQESRQELQQGPQHVMDMPVLREFLQIDAPASVVEAEAKVETEAKIEASAEVHVESKHKTQPWDENGVPDWAQERFKCLLFKVAGISLAVPLVKLNGVVSWDGKVTSIPGYSRSFLGVMRHQGRNVKVVDTAQVVLPEKQQEGILLPPEQRLKNVILVDNCNWGLACDGIGEVITLDKEEVRWRTSKGKLKWLSGTVLQHLCALLEVDAFTRLLTEGQEHQVP